MKQSFLARRLKRRLGRYIPLIGAVLLLFAAAAPLRFPLVNETALALLTMAIYYWGLFQPEQMSYPLVFGLGLAFDLISGLPVGVSSFCWLLLRGMVNAYGRMFAIGAFWGVWAGYALTSALSMLAGWGLLSYYHARLLPAAAPLLFWLTSAAVYPLAHAGMARFSRMLNPDRSSLHR